MSAAENTIADDDSDRSPARQRLAERIAGLAAARETEAAIGAALEASRQIEEAAAAALEDRTQALKASGMTLAAQLLEAARSGSEPPRSVLTEVDGDAAEASLLHGRLASATAARVDLEEQLTGAKAAVVAAQYGVSLAAQGVITEHTLVLISDALAAQERLASLRDTLWCIDRTSGVVHPERGYAPFPFPRNGVGLIYGYEPSDKRALEPVMNGWRAVQQALKSDADAPLTQ